MSRSPRADRGVVFGMADLEQKYRALLARIEDYPISDPAARAWMLAEIEAI